MKKEKLWKSYKNTGDKKYKDELIVEYIDLVKIISGRLYTNYNSHVEYDDIVSYGIIGLIDAIEKFDLSKNVKFETYANIRIRGAVIDQMRSLDWIPRSTRHKFRVFEEAINKLQNQFGNNYNDEDIAKELNVDLKELYDIISEISTLSIASLDEKIEENSNFGVKSNNLDFSPEKKLLYNESVDNLHNVIEGLPERERTIVNLYYFSELTYKEIAEILKISESRISQLHTKIIAKLRKTIGN
ncbi:sigma-70 family RNA polymerase sigma factor [Helicovermis profundi]|uniref:RNA polymerase sigma factor n=1 Tax=Helicovermis profundi TaxID=3065157 RepID=A0AAU9E444_9FIRM|nr:RNA polymerase sigma factor WhiG [Clostridia bacterium S502]